MFARITTYKMHPDKISDAETKLAEMMPQIMSMPGMKSFTNAIDEEGNGVVCSVVTSKEVSDANQEQVAEIWTAFSDFLMEPPSPSGYRVVAHDTN